jgi:hypothetical protein
MRRLSFADGAARPGLEVLPRQQSARARMRRCVGALLVAVAFWEPSPAAADGMRCGTKLVSDGDSTYDVHTRCGEPKFKTKRMELRTIRTWVGAPCVRPGAQCGYSVERTIEVQVEEWIYDFGPTQFVRYVTFEDGRLLRIVTGDYGVSR